MIICLAGCAKGKEHTAAEPESARSVEKAELVLAGYDISDTLKAGIAAYNASSETGHITVKDYCAGGVEQEAALLKLNTEMISGEYPDMICFSVISPLTLIRKGLLEDMAPYFDKDDQISREDLVIEKALEENGGIYYISNLFNVGTLMGKKSDFGSRYGWTVEEYLEMEKSLLPEQQMLYNMTRKVFIQDIILHYATDAIDWETGTCNFETEDFCTLIDAAARIRETPEGSNPQYFQAAEEVASGRMKTASAYIVNIWETVKQKRLAGCDLSFIGWPSAKGTCGAEAWLLDPIGILSTGSNKAECWEFLKYIIQNRFPEVTEEMPAYASYGLQMYEPELRREYEEAIQDSDYPVPLTEADMEEFFSMLHAIERTVISDENVDGIISNEIENGIAAGRTSAATAAVIQSKISIYLAEQSDR